MALQSHHANIFPVSDFLLPDGIGSWAVSATGIIYTDGLFLMYVKQTEQIANDVQKIRGKIRDMYGAASFDGLVTAKHIEFTKKYDLEVIQSADAAEKPVLYKGWLVGIASTPLIGNLYHGNYAEDTEPTPSGSKFVLRLKFPQKEDATS